MSNKYGENSNVIWTDKKRILGMPISFTRYSLVEKPGDWSKIFIKSGILSTTIEEVNLYRIYDIKIHQSLGQKIFGVGTITLCSNDITTPVMELWNIKKPYEIRNLLAQKIEEARDEKGVRIGEVY
ncbi:MAG: PH domain-containing protein [Clostridiales bacterium]|nr:PH domain-containing protein [Clostridiales bacterium]